MILHSKTYRVSVAASPQVNRHTFCKYAIELAIARYFLTFPSPPRPYFLRPHSLGQIDDAVVPLATGSWDSCAVDNNIFFKDGGVTIIDRTDNYYLSWSILRWVGRSAHKAERFTPLLGQVVRLNVKVYMYYKSSGKSDSSSRAFWHPALVSRPPQSSPTLPNLSCSQTFSEVVS